VRTIDGRYPKVRLMLHLATGWNTATIAARFAVIAVGVSAVLYVPASAEQVTTGMSIAANTGGDLNAIFKEQPCKQTKSALQFDAPITRVAKRLDSQNPVTIVAVGSSSTGGSGASSPSFAYPSRLERELRQRFPGTPVTVVNRGINGEDAADMMVRMDGILELKPDLVIWQLGTNAVMRDTSIGETETLLQTGITRIKNSGADVMLIDPQFAPKVNAKPAVSEMVGMISYVAKLTHVPLFRRYVAMRHWHDEQSIGFDRFISPDGLHMNDWGYSCLARLLADNIATAVTRSRAVADVQPFLQ